MFRSTLFATLLAATPMFAADEHDEPAHVFDGGGLNIVHPWAQATTGPTAYVYMELHNDSDAPVAIVGADSENATSVDLIGFVIKDGVSVATPLPPVPVAPGRTMDLVPDVMAIRLSGLTMDLEQGHHFDLHVITSAGKVEIDVIIEAADAHQHSHAGHQH